MEVFTKQQEQHLNVFTAKQNSPGNMQPRNILQPNTRKNQQQTSWRKLQLCLKATAEPIAKLIPP
ncbi:Hypothetical predicted protein, partial [Mytilus galloprovincialis]